MMANAEEKGAAPSRRKVLLKRAGMGLLLVVLVIGGFFLGIYLKILDGDEGAL